MARPRINSDPYHRLTEVVFFVVTLTLLAYYLPILATIFILTPLAIKCYAKLTVGICKSYKRIDGKTVIVTGANIGIGLETAKDLAKRGARVILACRNLDKGRIALIRQESGNENVVLKELDLSSMDSVRKFCQEILAEETRLDILVNNAGISVTKKDMTKDGMEVCMQTNHFSPFLLTHLLLDLLKKTGNARIVNVSSEIHRFVQTFNIENLNSEKSFSAVQVYSVSKLTNIYFTSELNRRLKDAAIKDITVNSLHPGGVRTAFLNHADSIWYMQIIKPILHFYSKTAEEGAQTGIYLAVSEEVDGVSGEYYADCKKSTPTKLARNAENAKILWEKSVKAVGLLTRKTKQFFQFKSSTFNL